MPRATVSAVVDEAPGRPTVVWLENGDLRLGFVPDLGGRLLAARLHGRETLWRNAALLDDALHPVAGHVPAPTSGALGDWVNHGGDKTWPAPQGWSGPGEWAGPPDPILDSGAYAWALEHDADGSASLTMTSGHDPRTGLSISRRFTLAPEGAGYDVVLTARNGSTEPVAWSLWNVMQRAAGGPGEGGVLVGSAGVGGEHRGIALAEGTGSPAFSTVDDTRVHVAHQDVVGKVGFPDATGWVAHECDGITTTLHFDVDAHAEYPDGGSRVEVWMEHPLPAPLEHLGGLNPPARIVEIEVLGPLTRLAPGASTTLALRCELSATEGAAR